MITEPRAVATGCQRQPGKRTLDLDCKMASENSKGQFDVLVIGAGINGAGIVREISN